MTDGTSRRMTGETDDSAGAAPGLRRRTTVRAAAWSLPIIAAAVAMSQNEESADEDVWIVPRAL
ncbi:hypothetical protein [Microbacterium sp. LWO12-1.2]|uniref:hypothetical protein n=1 Tax=Microbacterium sp. LWO12-1.2 TaxID=3135261 RepID=UPI00341328BF